MAKYQIYSNQTATNNNWVKLIPTDWKIVPLKYMCHGFVKDGPHETPEFIDEGVPFLSVDGIQNNKLVFGGCRYISTEDDARFSLKCKPQKGDILLGKAASVGKVAFVESDKDFNVWSPLAVIRPKDIKLGKFIYYCLQSYELQLQCDVFSNSNTQKNLGMTTIDNLSFPYPSIEEAEKISEFLNHETAQIDSLISKQEKLIQLLKEKRQAVISHAVTKGLNPNVSMKDSGVEWLGEVPEHWNTLPLKLCVQTRKGVAFKAVDFCDAGIRVVKASDIKQKTIRESETFLPNSYVNEFPKAVLHTDDLILSTVGSTPDVKNSAVGQIGKVPQSLSGSLLNQNTVVFSSTEILDQNFLYYLVQTNSYRDHLDLNAHGTANQASLNISDMLNFMISIPELNEQVDIKNYLDKKISKLEELELKILAMSISLNERRTALISAAVTGKIDVRNWQNPTEAKMEFSA